VRSAHLFTTLVLVAFSLLAATLASAQTTWYVDDDAPNDPGPGDPTISDPLEDGSADHPFDAIQEGINASVNGDTVLVLNGEYAGSGNFQIGFGGRAITLRSESGAEHCLLLGPGKVFSMAGGETNATVIRGFTISPSLNGTYGGGMWCYGSSPTLVGCVFQECRASHWGGGLLCEENANPLLLNCEFRDNSMTVDSIDAGGAGIYVKNSSPTLIGCDFIGNSVDSISTEPYAQGGGGAFIGSGSSPRFVNCRFLANRAADNSVTEGAGAGIFSKGNPTFVNCAFVGNDAGDGAAIYDYAPFGSCTTLINCTFTGNVGNGGSALSSWSADQIISSVFWGNSGVNPVSLFHAWALATYSCLEGMTGNPHFGEGCIDADPLFMRPPSPGADGVWGTDDDVYGDLRLQVGSPCIDAADCTALPPDTQDLDGDGDTEEPIPVDLDWLPRVVDDPDTIDTGTGFPCVDIGAYEYQPGPLCPADFTGDGLVNVFDLLQLLGAWGDCPGCAEDLTGDDVVNVFDLLGLLAVWGPCE
jgi:hypothetical protein